MKIELAVPDAVPFSKVRQFLADLGINAEYLREFYCGMSGVYVEVIALDAEGHPYVEGDELAVHKIALPLDRDA